MAKPSSEPVQGVPRRRASAGWALLLGALLLAAGFSGCIGSTEGDDSVGPTSEETNDSAANTTPPRFRNGTVEREVHILAQASVPACTEVTPCGVILAGDGPVMTRFGVHAPENGTRLVSLEMAWSSSTPLSEQLRLVLYDAEWNVLETKIGGSPLEVETDLASGEYVLAPRPPTNPGLIADETVQVTVEGPVDDRSLPS